MDSRKILVVDDNAELRKGLGLRLRANGYDVAFAGDAVSATATILRQKPDLVLLDLGLPGGDGFVVMERMRHQDFVSDIPVIVLTGRETTSNRDRAMQAGAVAFFQKPVDENKLLFAVWKALLSGEEGAES